MKELSDKKFDELLKQKADSVDFDFDESAWDKMEQKLRRRDRAIYIQRSSFVLLFVLLGGFIYLQLQEGGDVKNQITAKVSKERGGEQGQSSKEGRPINTALEASALDSSANSLPEQLVKQGSELKGSATKITKIVHDHTRVTHRSRKDPTIYFQAQNMAISDFNMGVESTVTPDSAMSTTSILATGTQNSSAIAANTQSTIPAEQQTPVNNEENDAGSKSSKQRFKPRFSFTALAGPDYSAVESFAGSKGKLNLGLLLNVAISPRLAVSIGARYGVKDYTAEAYDYQSPNPRAAYLAGIDGSCNILEIPVQASYAVFSKRNTAIRISSGLSSYLMLKERYDFHYTPASGYKTYTLTANNKNQHYFSVLSLSTSYNFRLKSSRVQWAVEPYLKLPLGGVGEGNVHLKSGGLSLNATYEINKKRH